MKITLWPNLLDTRGTEKSVTWDQLAKWLSSPIDYQGKNESPGWSPATFVLDQRRKERATVAYLLCLDFDETMTRDDIDAQFGQSRCMVHSSKSNTEERHRYRVALDLSRPVTAAEFELLWSGYCRPIIDKVDGQTKDISRFWYVPCRTPETKWEFWRHNGEPVDVDTVIDLERAVIAKAEREARMMRERALALSAQNRSRGGASVESRASAYVARMDPAIAKQGGHLALWQVVLRLVKGFELSEEATWDILLNEYNPRCVPAWSTKELEHKIRDASRAKVAGGWLLRNDRGPEPELPPCPEPEEETQNESPPEYHPDQAPANECYNEPPPGPEAPSTAAERYGFVSAQDLVLDVLTDINKPKEAVKCVTGIDELDAAMGGLRSQMVTVLAARTSFGKTTFALGASDKSTANGARVIWLPFEDSKLLYGRRIVAQRGGINATALRDKDLNYRERQRLMQVAQEAQTDPFMLQCIGKPVEYACKALSELAQEMKIDLVVVDYLQRVHTERRMQDRRNEVTFSFETLADTIKTIGASGLIISQLKRIEVGERPTMFDLKESGDLENGAEHIIMGWAKEFSGQGGEKQLARKVFLEKNKDGPLVDEDIEVPFDEVSACFKPNGCVRYDNAAQREDLDDLDATITGRY